MIYHFTPDTLGISGIAINCSLENLSSKWKLPTTNEPPDPEHLDAEKSKDDIYLSTSCLFEGKLSRNYRQYIAKEMQRGLERSA